MNIIHILLFKNKILFSVLPNTHNRLPCHLLNRAAKHQLLLLHFSKYYRLLYIHNIPVVHELKSHIDLWKNSCLHIFFLACINGTFGPSCLYNCSGNCFDNKTCDTKLGQCQKCASGWENSFCNKSIIGQISFMFT